MTVKERDFSRWLRATVAQARVGSSAAYRAFVRAGGDISETTWWRWLKDSAPRLAQLQVLLNALQEVTDHDVYEDFDRFLRGEWEPPNLGD